jgi:hypothetical protein
MTLTGLYTDDIREFAVEPIPAEAAMVMSSLDAGVQSLQDRRMCPRATYRTTTHLRLFRDEAGSSGWEIFTRDVNRRGMGFLTRHRLPLGYGGKVILPDLNGDACTVHCTLLRCREASPGWFEGSVTFNREQPQFDL